MVSFGNVVRIFMVLCMGLSFSALAEDPGIDSMIRQNRMGELIIKAKPGATVRVEQIRHEFWFGAALSSAAFSGRLSPEDTRKYKETFLANFNAAVTENALKWHVMERRKGQVDYRICFANPAVKGILMWGFWERANWIPQSSLYLSDWTPTPAARAYHDLVFNQWWTKWQGKADDNGNCRVSAFFGKYRILVDGQEKTVDLKKSAGTTTVSFQ